MTKRMVSFLIAAVLSGCAIDCPMPQDRLVCPPPVVYAPIEQRAMAAELRGLPAASMLVLAMADYHAERDALLACREGGK